MSLGATGPHPARTCPPDKRRRAVTSVASWSSRGAGAVRRLSMTVCGTSGASPRRMRAVNAANSASFSVSRPDPRSVSRRRKVASSDLTHTSRTVPPPRPSTQERQRPASWICWVNGPDSRTGQPWERISRAVAVIPAYSCALTCSSYQGPSRSPGGRAAASRTAATNGPYIVSLSSRAGAGSRRASSSRATVLFPAPGGPATTHAGAWTLMRASIGGRPRPPRLRVRQAAKGLAAHGAVARSPPQAYGYGWPWR